MLICVKVERKCFNSEGVTSTSGFAKKWIKLSSNVALCYGPHPKKSLGASRGNAFTGLGGGLVFTKRNGC